MPSINMDHSASTHKNYLLNTNVVAKADSEIDPNAESWKLPYSIDDSDLTFDGKPLNMLYEENRWKAEHHVYESRDQYFPHYPSSSKEKCHKSSRGRSRQSKK